MDVLGGTEDRKEKRTALGGPGFSTLGGACKWMITNSILCAMDWLDHGLLARRRLTSSQNALLRVLLCLAVAAAAAAVAALRQPVGRRLHLDLAHVALAFTVATHCIKICLLFRFFFEESDLLLSSLFAAMAVLVFAAVDLLFFMAIHRGDGAEKE